MIPSTSCILPVFLCCSLFWRVQACRSARRGRAPGPFPDGQKNTQSVRPTAFSRTRLVVGQKGHFSCHQFRDEESSVRESRVRNRPLPFSVLVRCLPSPSLLSLPIPLIDGGPVVRPVRGGDGGKKVSDVAIEIYCRDCGGGQPRERDIPPQEMDT